jgi:acyl-coenzyme A thioesterase THEM4
MPPYPAFSEVRTLLTLGSDVNGYPHTAHGGLVATVIDEVMGILLSVNKDHEEQRILAQEASSLARPRLSTMTASLELAYRKPVPTPCTVLVRVWFESVDDRKHFIRGSLDNGAGEVLTQARALMVRAKEKL